MSTENGKASSEPEGYRSMQVYIEKKIRNLEKRKNRLDDYQKRQEKGETLEQQQIEALASMATVQGNLDFARDVLGYVSQTLTEQERLAKKADKKAKIERDKRELDQLESVVRAQALLDEMGADELKEAFARGVNGVTLSAEELESLDLLYQAVTPRRETPADASDGAVAAWPARLRASAENWQHYLAEADRPLQPGGSTFRNVAELVKRLAGLPFFTADRQPAVATQPPAPAIAEQQQQPVPAEALQAPVDEEPEPPAQAKPAWSQPKHWADEPMPAPSAASSFPAANNGGGGGFQQAGPSADTVSAGDADNGGEFIAYSRGRGGRSRGGGGFNEHRGGRGGGGFRGGGRGGRGFGGGGGERGGRGFGGRGGGGGGHRGERTSFGADGHRGGFGGGDRASFGGEGGGGHRGGGFRGGRSSYARHNSFASQAEQHRSH
uniref:Caprin-1_dimer domain-containing protein n=1 Tax=Macrostomum lignano TaxID=282301 RepID=A0A1I8GJL2_9PLAT